jgi:quercetin dioxygenase-like cupin family protein
MITFKPLLTIALVAVFTAAFSQHNHTEEKKAPSPRMTFDLVLSQALSDTELKDFKVESVVMTIPAGLVDTVSHRHDCELFGYVLEGSVQIALTTKEVREFSTGQMFYEKRNILHTITKNSSQSAAAKVLLIFIIKNGRAGYTAEYPAKK